MNSNSGIISVTNIAAIANTTDPTIISRNTIKYTSSLVITFIRSFSYFHSSPFTKPANIFNSDAFMNILTKAIVINKNIVLDPLLQAIKDSPYPPIHPAIIVDAIANI